MTGPDTAGAGDRERARPSARPSARFVPWRLFLAGLAVALLLAGGLSVYASQSPDGLEKVAADKGIARTEKEHSLKDSPLGEYEVKGVGDPRLSGGVAGVAGVMLTLAVGGALFWTVRRRTPRPTDDPAAPGAARSAGSGSSGNSGNPGGSLPGRDG